MIQPFMQRLNALLSPRLFWLAIAVLYGLGGLQSLVKCCVEGWTLRNVAQVWVMLGSAITNVLYGLVLNER